MGKLEVAGVTYEDISSKQNGQRGGVLRIIEPQVLLEAIETSVGQIIALRWSFSDVSEIYQSMGYRHPGRENS